MKKSILYLRTDLWYQDLQAGGSIGHTIGVIQGFLDLNYEVICVTTCMQNHIKKLKITQLYSVGKPPFLSFLRWKLGCLVQGGMVIFAARVVFKKYNIDLLYQRYSIFNITGILLSWWYQKKLILEFNGSEVWASKNWNGATDPLGLFKIAQYFEVLNFKKAHYIVVVSQALQNQLIALGIAKEKILVNPNGVNPDCFAPIDLKVRKVGCEIQS